MVIARFEFLPDHANDFCEEGQTIQEMQFDDIIDLVEFTKEIEHCLTEVLMYDGDNLISLREISKDQKITFDAPLQVREVPGVVQEDPLHTKWLGLVASYMIGQICPGRRAIGSVESSHLGTELAKDLSQTLRHLDAQAILWWHEICTETNGLKF